MVPADTAKAAFLPDSAFLAQFCNLDDLRAPLQNCIRNLPAWHQLVRQTWNETLGLQIDVILQEHLDASGRTDPTERMARSQAAIQLILEREAYPVIGMEGCDLTRIDGESQYQLLRAFYQKRGLPLPAEEEMRGRVSMFMQSNGGTRYALEHRNTLVFGCEVESLLTAEGVFVEGKLDQYLSDPYINNLLTVLGASRSVMAVATTIRTLRAQHQTRGVIIFGAAHEPDLKFILRSLGIRSKFYNTTA
ncbi:MAG: hypothetical protein WC734_04525 [Patescibacteria group bacterium]|jgi:hypothetical protein